MNINIRSNKNSLFSSVVFVLLAIAFASCSSTYKIQSEVIKPLDINNIHSFKFYNPASESEANFSFSEKDKKTLYDAFAREFKAQKIISSHDADIIVRLQGGITVEVVNNTNYNRYNDYYSRYNWYMYNDYNELREKSNKQIVLIVNFLEPTTKKLLWQGTAYGKINKGKEDFDLKLEEAARLILQEFKESSISK